jgi:hypothetical protein
MFSFLNKHNIQVNNINGEVVSLAFPTQEDLPPSAQGYHTNNLYDGFPPLMSDSRSLIASWQPEAYVNNQILQSTGIKSNWEYRKYLVENAEQIMKDNFSSSANDIGYYVNNDNLYGSSVLPSDKDIMGDSDLKNMYLGREELQARRIAPVVTQEELLRMLGRAPAGW